MHRLIKKLALCATALSVCFAVPSLADPQQTPKPVPTQKAPAPASLARPALWKVSDSDTTIYLFGTVHALPRGISWMEGPIAKAFNGSQHLVTEIAEVSPETMQDVVMKTALLPKGESLFAMLSPKDRVLLNKTLKAAGLPVAGFDRFEPWYVAMVVAALPVMKMGYTAANGVEMQLSAKAKALGQTQVELETVEYQLGLFDTLPRKVQLNYLHQVLVGLPRMAKELELLVKYWGEGNPDKLARLMNAEQSDAALIAALLTNRNKNWARWIDERMARPGTVFLAVGAGHLAGKQSVQVQLTKKGRQVARIQ